MNKISMDVWGRPFDLEVVYDCYSGEKILDSQEEAYRLFLRGAKELLNAAKPLVEAYCLENNRTEIGCDKIDNIFKYVHPKTIYIKRVENDRKVALLCAYKFNPDDGLAIVFQHEMFSEIGSENIVL